MPLRVPEKIQFLNDEISGLRGRIAGDGNAVQRAKMEMLADIRDDYTQSIDRAKQRAAEEIEQ